MKKRLHALITISLHLAGNFCALFANEDFDSQFSEFSTKTENIPDNAREVTQQLRMLDEEETGVEIKFFDMLDEST